MDDLGTETRDVAVGPVTAVRVRGPASAVRQWLADPDLETTFPGFSHGPPSRSASPYGLHFEQAADRRLRWNEAAGRLKVRGDLDSLDRRDFRRLLMHVCKASVRAAGGALVHAACVVSRQGHGVLLAGASGSGKSMLALHLAARGFAIAATDISMLDAQLCCVAGSRHMSLYPAVLREAFPEVADGVRPPANQDGFRQKVLLSPTELCARGVFGTGAHPVPVTQVMLIRVRAGETMPFAAVMGEQEALDSSLIVRDEWSAAPWLCPSWELLMPPLSSAAGERQAFRLALALADRPHYRLQGDLDACGGFVARLAG